MAAAFLSALAGMLRLLVRPASLVVLAIMVAVGAVRFGFVANWADAMQQGRSTAVAMSLLITATALGVALFRALLQLWLARVLHAAPGELRKPLYLAWFAWWLVYSIAILVPVSVVAAVMPLAGLVPLTSPQVFFFMVQGVSLAAQVAMFPLLVCIVALACGDAGRKYAGAARLAFLERPGIVIAYAAVIAAFAGLSYFAGVTPQVLASLSAGEVILQGFLEAMAAHLPFLLAIHAYGELRGDGPDDAGVFS